MVVVRPTQRQHCPLRNLGTKAGVAPSWVPWYQVPGRTRFPLLCYQDQLRQSPGLPGTVLVALGALPV